MREQVRWILTVYRRNRTGVLIALALTVTAALVEIASIALYYPILTVFTGTQIAAGTGARLLARVRALLGIQPSLLVIVALLVGLLLARAACLYLSRIVSNHYELQFNLQLKRDFLRRFTDANWDFVVRWEPGSLLNVFSQYSTAASRGVFYLVELLIDAVSCVAYIGFAIYVSPVFAVFIVASGLVVGPLLKRIYWRMKVLVEQSIRVQNDLANKFLDYLRGMKTFKSMSLEGPYLQELDRDLRTFTTNERRSYRIQAALNVTGEPLFSAVGAVFLLAAHHWFAVGMETVVIIFALLSKTYSRLNSLQSNFGRLVRNAPAIRFCQEFGDSAQTAQARAGTVLDGRICTMEFDHVSFVYPDGRQVFEGVSFKLSVERGLFVLAGPSGIGKSTLFDLLTGLLLPSAGVYRINGVDVRELDLRALRARVGFVPQSPVLFNRSIKENISLREDADTNMAYVETAARMADAHDFVTRLSRGYETVMGKDGASLSLGQIQRISMARALYQRPDILFFDEPTSALDSRAAAEVMNVIERISESYPVFLISHSGEIRAKSQALILLEGRTVKIMNGMALGARS